MQKEIQTSSLLQNSFKCQSQLTFRKRDIPSINSDRWLSCEVDVSQLSEQLSGNISVSPSLDIDVPCRTNRRVSGITIPSGRTSSDRCTVILFLLIPNSPTLRARPVSESWDVELDFSPMPLFLACLAQNRYIYIYTYS